MSSDIEFLTNSRAVSVGIVDESVRPLLDAGVVIPCAGIAALAALGGNELSRP